MPNGMGLGGDASSTQSALIVPQPGVPDIYYIFTTDNNGGPFGFSYSIVDMTLNGGHGDVTTKNVQLLSSSDEKVAAITAADGSFWIMAHEWGTNGFYAYNLSSSGLNPVPVISFAGTVHTTSHPNNVIGQMKFSHDGKKIACAVYHQIIAELFDFNDTTGVVSNPMTISFNPFNWPYGIEFSPDNSKLYITHLDSVFQYYYLDQFDLSSNDSSTIVSSGVNISSSDDLNAYRALQLGLDGKIYVAQTVNGYLAVINSPNLPGISCGFNNAGIFLDDQFLGHYSLLGLPGFPVRLKPPPAASFSSTDSTLCEFDCINFTSLSTNADSWQWTFYGAANPTSTAQNPQHVCYFTAGSYDVKLVVTNSSGTDSLLIPGFITVVTSPPSATIYRQGDTLFVTTDTSYVSYQWYKDSIVIPNAVDTFYVLTGSGNYNVSIVNSNGCAISVGINIVLGMKDPQTDGISVYPNPVGNELIIDGIPVGSKGKTIEIFNTLGEKWPSEIVKDDKKMTINVSRMAQGMYFIRLIGDDQNFVTKFLKE